MLSTPLMDNLVQSNCRALTHSIVPSQVHTHIWLFTGVHTLLTFQAPAGTLQVLSPLKNVVPSGVQLADNIAISTAQLPIVVVIQVVPEPVTSPDSVIVWFACNAVSAKSNEALTEASSLLSSIDPAIIEALICCPVNVKSISEVSDTVTSQVLVPDRLPSFVISLEVTNLFVVEVSSISSASRTTTPVCQLTLSTFPPQLITKSPLHSIEDQFIVFMFVPLTRVACVPLNTEDFFALLALPPSSLSAIRNTSSLTRLIFSGVVVGNVTAIVIYSDKTSFVPLCF